MSIVGPRPALPKYLETYSLRQRRRLAVRGGITCLAQINGSSHLSWDERIEYDLIYIDTQSLWMDLKIILKTILVVILGEERYVKHPNGN
jgi:lipopolysaccharide/colanic/teichoic acid biosynthesis glycosyltransferase